MINDKVEKSKSANCIFCAIVEGKSPASIVHDGGDTLFFKDISPVAKVHVLGITKEHIQSINHLPDNPHIVAKLFQDIMTVVKKLGINETGYRVIANTGPDAGPHVPHIHFHILGGESLGPLRC